MTKSFSNSAIAGMASLAALPRNPLNRQEEYTKRNYHYLRNIHLRDNEWSRYASGGGAVSKYGLRRLRIGPFQYKTAIDTISILSTVEGVALVATAL
ncbi:unnamed protein product [Nezara viridula]|uniref:Uncharacterized protein n=1 Tax=Nezara viridula TaxID=85310 RepID=A0A9P0MMG9_NEZVI|nr:unnamed protein product [Nezara viridula]